mmetsp:Transcript_40060/g.68335  ORF Transcript_40060/g.68335 Transcript_40060/m.68335 type:complete len:127 (+) Transcript_40060:75-455(+)|eukprot:CAMPEP_0183703266 /NCGR_PEP_ID=MMETSP0737-20130205/1071_1 /TAXON_ID=385413 /ORGANISM="Thalassiosira miniscula, Strain CCMP1093" /LENGTH=126 /DNA_ID=CAMNT_0025929987 /DNA_START=61 /DNA_END=441 /DNA_ORIENTATION=-
MTFSILGRTALLATRRRATVATSQQAKRRMGSAAPAPEWTGIDKVVRGYFPQDDQLAAAILGGYFGLFCLYKIKSAFSSAPVEEAPVAVAAAPSSAGAIPDVDSEEFGAFLESEENVMKLVESFEK